MTMLGLLSRPFFWLVLYFAALLGFGSIYINSLKNRPSFLLTSASNVMQADGKLSVTLLGLGIDDHPAYLSFDPSNRRAVVGNIPLAGRAIDIEIINERAYVVTQMDGVNVFSLNDPGEPVLDMKLKTFGGWHSDYDEKSFYLSSYSYGLAIYSVDGMKLVPRRIAGTAVASIHRGNRIFVAGGNDGLSVYEYDRDEKKKNSAASRLLGSLKLPGYTLDLCFLGNHLVAASSAGGLHLVDVSAVEEPRLVQTISGQKNYEKVWLVGDIVYAALDDQQLDLFRLVQGRLSPVGRLPLFGKVRDFLLAGERLYLAETSFGVSSLDIHDPAHPKRIGMVGTPGEASGLALLGDYLYVASNSQGVQIVDTKRFGPYESVSSLDTPGIAFGLALDGQWLYVADGDAGLQIVDRSDVNNLKIVAQLSTQYRAKLLVKAGDMIYMLLEHHGLLCVDVSEPLRPKLVGQLDTNESFVALAVRGSALFTTTNDGRLLKIDISDPADLQIVDSVDLSGKPRMIQVAGDDVYIASGKAGLQIVRFSPGQPGRLIGGLSRPWPMSEFSDALGLQLRDGYAYVTHGDDGIQVIDIRQPEHPKDFDFIPLPARGLTIGQSDSYIVVSTRWDGYFFIDVTQPQKPQLVANINVPHVARNFQVEGDKLYVPGHSRGISIIPLPIKSLDTFKQSRTFNPPQQPGWYDLSVSRGKEFVRLDSALKID